MTNIRAIQHWRWKANWWLRLLAVGLGSLIGIMTIALNADAQSLGPQVRSPLAMKVPVTPPVMAKIYRRPLLRAGRIQFCLKERGLFQGRINNRMSPATVRALRQLRDELQFKSDDVEQDWALHAALWRDCRPRWVSAGGALDRFGMAMPVAAVSDTRAAPVRDAAARLNSAVAQPVESTALGRQTVDDTSAQCLGPDQRPSACDLPCLPKPAEINADDALAYERRLNFKWCKACVLHAGDMRLDDIVRMEAASGLTLCPDPRRLIRARPAAAGAVMVEALQGTRALFRAGLRASSPHDAFAVIVSVSAYGPGLPVWPRAEKDAAAVRALLSERLGFRANRIIELHNPTRAELDGVLGRKGNAKGLLSERLKDAAGSPVFIYFSGLGAIGNDENEAYLLPVDAVPKRERATGFALDTLYQNVTRMGAGPVTIVLEADFASDPRIPVVSPNAPETRANILPRLAVRGLTVFTASERDQRPLEDAELGMSLFTKHLIAGMSGHADAAPLGNGDGTVDTSEAFAYAAQRTIYAARKLSGVLQQPLHSQGRTLPINRIGVLAR